MVVAVVVSVDDELRSAFGTGAVPSWYTEHVRRGHWPRRKDCEHCVRAIMRAKQHRRRSSGHPCSEGYVLSLDFTGRYAPDVDGYAVVLVGVLSALTEDADDTEAGYGFAFRCAPNHD